MSNTPDDATVAAILCCATVGGCGNHGSGEPCPATFGRTRLDALRDAGFEIVTTAEALAIRATTGHAIEHSEEAAALHKLADRLAHALRLAVAADQAMQNYLAADAATRHRMLFPWGETQSRFRRSAAAILAEPLAATLGHEAAGQGSDA